jgi:hypothetical protein
MRSDFNKRIRLAAIALTVLALLFMFFAFTVGPRPVATHGMISIAYAAVPPVVNIKQISEEPESAFLPLDVPLAADLQYEIYLMCLEAGVPFEVEMGLINCESDFDPGLVSDTDDHGLAQINRCNFEWLQEEMGPIDFYDPAQSVRAGLRILGPLWEKHDPHRALMAYNQGEGGAKRKWADGQISSKYSRKVLAQAEIYGWSDITT